MVISAPSPAPASAREPAIVAEQPDLNFAALVTSAAIVQPMSDELRRDVENHLAEGRLVYSIHEHGELGGFALFRTIGPVLYLAGIMLRPSLQGRGVAVRAVEQAKRDSNLAFLGLRTQSPRMWVAGSRMTSSWFPYPPSASCTDYEAESLGPELARAIGCSFPQTTGFYGAPLYGSKPVHADTRLQTWWDDICTFERGDAVICVGRLR